MPQRFISHVLCLLSFLFQRSSSHVVWLLDFLKLLCFAVKDGLFSEQCLVKAGVALL